MAARDRRRATGGSATPSRRARMSAALQPSGASIVRRLVMPSASPARRSRLAFDVGIWAARRFAGLVRRHPESLGTERLRAGQAVRIDAIRPTRRRPAR